MTAARAPLALVAALTRNRVLGKDGRMPWHLPEDLKQFRAVTEGHAIIMGRATFQSIGRPLPKRRNIVVSRNPAFRAEGCEVVPDLGSALRLAREQDPEPRVVGGGQLYAAALPLATKLILTLIDAEYDGDTFFPAYENLGFRETARRRGDGVDFVTYER